MKLLLRKALGLAPRGDQGKKADFSEFCGVWTEADEAEFEKNTEDLHKVDPRDW
jgi:hypothetical protein